MPALSKRQKQAKQQRIGAKIFGKRFMDDPIQALIDPEYIPDEEDCDSDNKDISQAFTPLAEQTISQADLDDEEDWDDEGDDDSAEPPPVVGSKRAQREEDSSEDELDSDGDLEDRTVFEIMMEAMQLQKGPKVSVAASYIQLAYDRPQRKEPRTMTSRASYTGTSRSNTYAKKAQLLKAAKGTAPMTKYFTKLPVHESSSRTHLDAPRRSRSSSSSRSSPTGSSHPSSHASTPPRTRSPSPHPLVELAASAPPLPVPPPPLTITVTPAGPAPREVVPLSVPRSPLVLAPELELPPSLDINEDDNDLPPGPPVPLEDIVASLLKDAQRHKAFTPMFKLTAVKNFLALREKFRRVPKIKNPAMRASLSVAKSVSKGVYLAKQIRHLALYISRFKCLPPSGSGRHHAHPSLLNDERIFQAVRRYLTLTDIEKVSH